jgi:hypothetical protein
VGERVQDWSSRARVYLPFHPHALGDIIIVCGREYG